MDKSEALADAPAGVQIDDYLLEYERPRLYPKQLAAIFDPKRYSCIEASTKAGKAQPLDSLVYTPAGPVRMGDLCVGQRVLTPGGSAAISAIYPQGEREILRVTFADGAVVEADADHLWEVHQFGAKPQIVTTEQLQTWKEPRLRRAWVPKINPVQFETRNVPLDPYLLGALIGDGGMSGTTLMFSSADEDVLEYVRAALPVGHNLRYSMNHDYHVTAGAGAAQLREDGAHIRGILQRMGLGGKLSHDKFVPDDYRYNSIEVRMGVLQGIFDTDGFVDKHGQPALEQTSERLARDVEEIVQSLGGSVLTRLRTVNGYRAADGRFVTCRPVWRQVVRMPDGSRLFRMERKKSKCKPKQKTGHRMFRSIEFARRAQAQCIQIDDARHLYLTNGFIPTHNTAGCIAWIVEKALYGRDGQNFWWVAPVSGQADIAFRRCLRSLPPDIGVANLTLKTITIINGAIIWFKSADKPDSLYGEDVHGAVIDEASRVKEPAWWAVRSTLTATRGQIRLIGNVKGRRNFFYNLCRKGEQGDPSIGFHKITAVDAVKAGVLAQDEIDDAQRLLPEAVFRELYLAEPSDDGGNPFGIQHIAKCVLPEIVQSEPAVFGIDLGKKQDYTVVTGLDIHGRVCRFFREGGGAPTWEGLYPKIQAVVQKRPALVDDTGLGDPIVERLQKEPGSKYEGYTFSAASKQRLMEGLAVAIQNGEVGFPDGPIRQELEQFEFEYTRTGVRYSAPSGYHDDCVMSLALAVMHKAHAKAPMKVSDTALQRARQMVSRRR